MPSFTDFYNENSIIPVRQLIPNHSEFVGKRKYLLESLGVSSIVLHQLSVCEFGPGTGQNAKALLDLGVSNITFVDASTQALKHLYELQKSHSNTVVSLDVVNSDFVDFCSDKKFNLVIAEGCIAHQARPASIAKIISSHVCDSGIFLFSTISGLSHLSETLRRLYSSLLLGKIHPNISDLKSLIDFFEPDLLSLPSRSRKISDWCLDVLVQPLCDTQLFSQADAIDALGEDFQVYHSLPSLVSPFYWYKEFSSVDHNAKCLDSYHMSNMCLIANSAPPSLHSKIDGLCAEKIGNETWNLVCDFQRGNACLDEILIVLRELSAVYTSIFPFVSDYLDTSCRVLSNFNAMYTSADYKSVSGFWGRGQQYISMIKIEGTG